MLTHKGTVTLKTPRLVLRRMTLDDVPAAFRNWASDERVPKHHSWDVYTDVEPLREYVAKRIADYEKPDCYDWAIIFDGEMVGAINLHAITDKAEHVELGYSLGSKWWGMGIMTEAVGAVIRFAFEELNANKVNAAYDTENPASGRVMQKNGMTQEGLLREHKMHKDGTRGDLAWYAILKSEWNART